MPTLTLNGRSAFYAHRPSAGPPVVFIHGAGGSHLDWPPTLRRLDRANPFFPDLPGHGRSQLPPSGPFLEMAAYAAWVERLIAALGLAEVTLVGHSMGGAIVQTLARQPPPWLSRIVLLGSAPQLPVNPTILAGVRSPRRLADTLHFINRISWHAPVDQQLRDKGLERFLENDSAVLAADFSACNAFNSSSWLPKVDVPALVIHGERDKMVPLAQAEQLAVLLPQAELHTLPETGHMLMWERPVAVADAISTFVHADDHK